ncbi:MAG: AtpZ/AtpI family protein [Chloroflexota bacterium]
MRYSKFAGAALEFPSTVIGGLFLGYILDTYLDTTPWFTTVLTLIALIGAFVRLVQWTNYFKGKR